MEFNRIYFLIILLLGVLLISSYYIYLSKITNIDLFWGKTNLFYRNYLFIVSMVVCTIAFICMLIYLYLKDNFTKIEITNIFMSLLGIVLISLFWLPLTILYINYKKSRSLTLILLLLVLLIVGMSSLYLVLQIYKLGDNSLLSNMAFYGMIYFTFHTIILDLFYWSFNFLSQF